VRDARWRNLAKLREDVAGVEPGTDSRDAVLALLLALHDELGPRAIGAAINALDAKDKRLRINHVRYYSFDELEDALQDVLEDKAQKKRARELLK